MCICEPQVLEIFLCRDFSLALVWVRRALLNFSFAVPKKIYFLYLAVEKLPLQYALL